MTRTDRMVIAHGILCLIGFLFFLPLGALIARYFRTSTNAWFKAHQIIQSFLAGPIVIVGWALGVAVIADGGGPHFDSTHTVCLQTCGVLSFFMRNLNRDAAPRTCGLHPIPRSSFYWHCHPQVQAQIRRHTPSIAKLLPCGPWHSHHHPIFRPGPQWVQGRIPPGHRPTPFA